MSAAIEFVEQELKREHLRLFHLTGEGIESFLPAGPLVPADLDQTPTAQIAVLDSLPLLHAQAITTNRAAARRKFISEVTECRDLLAGLCPPESSPTAETAAAVFGREAGAFFDTESLAKTMQRPSRARVMEPHRRARLQTALASLDGFLSASAAAPALWLFNPGSVPLDLSAAGGKALASDSPLLDGMHFLRQMLDSLKTVLQSIRIARLESDSAYEPSHHDDAVQRMDWQYAAPDQLRALPAVVVLETAERLAQTSLTALGRILRSGLPVQILILSEGMGTRDLSELSPDLGYLAIAHREAFVMQASLAGAENLKEGLAQMVATLRPAVAIVASGETPLVHLSRLFPLFRHDPDRGESWAQRFRLFHELTSDTLTPAHAALMFAEMRQHFRLIPASAWDSDQMELGQYLAAWSADARAMPPSSLPYLWVKDAHGATHRAAITRELAYLCVDRRRAWRVFEELAGLNNAYVRAAEARLREQMRAEAAAREKEAIENARQEGVRNAVSRLVSALTNPAAVSVPTTAATRSTPVPAPPALTPAETAGSAEPFQPYIDSLLCTSCNDCFKINPRMFAYDANKQAYISDLKAGTHAELVKAAEACPAKCIHAVA